MLPEKVKGFVKSFSDTLGLGIITPTDGSIISKDVYFERGSIVGDGVQTLDKGMGVEFEVQSHQRATNVSVMKGVHITCTGAEPGHDAKCIKMLADVLVSRPELLLNAKAFNTAFACYTSASASVNQSDSGAASEIIDLVTPTKIQRDESNFEDDFDDLCIRESLSSEEAISNRVREAEENGKVIDLC